MLTRAFYTIIFLFTFAYAHADTFIVTSNADSGPGTLREALTLAAANGSAVKDFIHFNLPDVSEAGRTITLQSELPDLTSNLVIDGTTQPGAKFGVSDAKILLVYDVQVQYTFSGLKIISQNNVEVYGLYVKYIADINSYHAVYTLTGIQLQNIHNVQIGAAGKGNVFSGFYSNLSVNATDKISSDSENFILKSNFFGIEADGTTLALNPSSGVFIGLIVGEITIGGNELEGNIFANGFGISQYNNSDIVGPNNYYTNTPATILIKNNKVGVDYWVEKSFPESQGVSLGTITPRGKNFITIEDNVITGKYGTAIFITNMGETVSIHRNYIGTNKTFTKTFDTGGIMLDWITGQAAIGNDNINDANFITNCNPVTIGPYVNATINKNSFFCTKNAQSMHPPSSNAFFYPEIKVSSITPSTIEGIATPNSKIELFYSDKCGTCSPQTFFGTTVADASGNWKYNGSIMGTVIASATLNKATSDFTTANIDVSQIKVINACNNKGSIIGAIPFNAAHIKWIDSQGQTIGTNADLIDVKPGKYRLIAENGDCNKITGEYEILPELELQDQNILIKKSSCGNSDGSITGLNLVNYNNSTTTFSWKDDTNKEWSKAIDLVNVKAGTYTLTITGTCTTTYGPITLTNTTGPNIDQSNPIITSTPCGQSKGSITGIIPSGTGVLKYSWKNEVQVEVATTKDLLNQPAGKYVLSVTDESSCSPAFTSAMEIPETNGITIDNANVQITRSFCINNDGRIKVPVSGATTYTWYNNLNNTIAGNNAELTNARPGNYYLIAANGTCSKKSDIFTVGQITSSLNYSSTRVITNATCGLNNGSIEVIFLGVKPIAYRWTDLNGNTLGNSPTISNVDAGTYRLYITDDTGCERPTFQSYTIPRTPVLAIDNNIPLIINDQCRQGKGSISQIKVTGGQPPYSYTWKDGQGKTVGTTLDLKNVPEGDYSLNITDQSTCMLGVAPIHVSNQTQTISSPIVPSVQLCSAGKAIIAVSNSSSLYKYRLYEGISGSNMIAENSDGRFEVSVTENQHFYVSQVLGECESQLTEVSVQVGLSTLNIANVISPNSDGINDTWKLTGMENYPSAQIQVYNRYGNIVYESKGYNLPFDGTSKGQALPTGTYYYIINLSKSCKLLSGSLTLLR